MKYWFYSEGNILGPYEPAEMLALPAFAEESLVCPETATGDNPGDWRPASQIAEIASALSFGPGRAITAGAVAGAYEYETGFNSSARYFEDKEPSPGASYGELLDTIDNILGAYKEGPASAASAPGTDYELAEKFDVRLSHIQEELEAARWEKNLLLEKIRTKEMEERKNRERIQELEARLKSELGRADDSAREVEQVRHLADLKANAETVRQIEEIKREELELKQDMPKAQPPADAGTGSAGKGPRQLKAETISENIPLGAAPAEAEPAAPEIEVKSFKSITRGSEIKLETSLGKELKAEAEDAGLTSRKFRSLGQTQEPAYVYGGSHYDKPLPGPEAAPPGAFKPEALEPLPQQAGGVVYDFTVVTAKRPDTQQFQIETRYEAPAQQAQPAQPQPVKPPTYDFGVQQQPPAYQQPAQAQMQPPAQMQAPAQMQPPAQIQPQAQPQVQHGFQFQPHTPATEQQATVSQLKGAGAQSYSPSAQFSPISSPKENEPAAAPDSPDKTQRMPVPAVKGKAETKTQEKPRKKGGKKAFLAILVIFGSIAAGGLGYFFMGEGASFSEFTMLNLGGKKKPAVMGSQLDAKAEPEPVAAQQEPAAQAQQEPAQQAQQTPAPEAQQQATATPPAAAEKTGNENIKKALDIVKGYKLSGGRGTIASWFANSFLSGSSGGASEEWTATPLHGDILAVQYRLLRPRQEPLVYQFEVDAAKRDIVRGLNNYAMDLLNFSEGQKSVSAAPVKKPAAKRKARKAPAKPRQIPILPLPDAPAAGAQVEQDPTGFENAQADGSEQVKYLKAQESDEELF